MTATSLKGLTPVLIVDAIEPVLGFWVDKLGFTKGSEVPHEGKLGFVMLERDGVKIMYQSRKSVASDVPPLSGMPQGASFLYINVDNLEEVITALKGVPPVIPRRKTFYGEDELIVREPAGNVVTFAQPVKR